MKRIFFTIIALLITMPHYASAAPTLISRSNTSASSANHKDGNSAADYKAMIEEYKKQVQDTPKEIRDEIKAFRLSIAKLQKEKREIYKRLSMQAQDYLKQEEEFRSKLPIESLGSLSTVGIKEKLEATQSNK